MLRQEIDMDDRDARRSDVRDGTLGQRLPDTLPLPARVHDYIQQHRVAHAVAQDGAPRHQRATRAAPGNGGPVTSQRGGVIGFQPAPAHSLAQRHDLVRGDGRVDGEGDGF